MFWSKNPPVADEIQRFMEEVKSLGYKDKPRYEKLRSVLQSGLKSLQQKDDGQLEFTAVGGAAPAPAPAKVSTCPSAGTNAETGAASLDSILVWRC